MKKIIGFFPKIRFIPDAPNLEFNEQEKNKSDLIREHEENNPDDFVWGIARLIGETVFAQPRSELKKETKWSRYNYCKMKGIFYDDDGFYIPNPLYRR